MQRDARYDVLKGIAIIMMVAFHAQMPECVSNVGRMFHMAQVVNYTDASVPYTRIHEFRLYHPECQGAFAKPRGTIITREYPVEWKSGDEPYYPMDNAESRELLCKYQALSATVPNLILGGRLGEYKYYDMDKSIAAALQQEIV